MDDVFMWTYGIRMMYRNWIEWLLMKLPLVRLLYARKIRINAIGLLSSGEPCRGTFRTVWIFRWCRELYFSYAIGMQMDYPKGCLVAYAVSYFGNEGLRIGYEPIRHSIERGRWYYGHLVIYTSKKE